MRGQGVADGDAKKPDCPAASGRNVASCHTSVPYAKLEKPPIDRQFDGRVRTLTIFFEATRAGLEDL